ncbi:MAG: Tat pathway signal protein [Alphaproteobacteria bacterium]|nr:Tat pathway signal protein [Alphaproteobacteria bacterium]MBU2417111.1 Tat pathway signal protein [Alphaproteobacteria bacterium]
MARTPAETAPTPADHQQMDRSNDPEITRAMDEAAPAVAMASRRQRLTGSAVGVGSVGFDESGAFDVGDPEHDPRENPEAD